MHDIPILLVLIALAVAAWLRPWLGVLVLVAVETLPPQGYASDFMRGFPAYQALFALVLARLAVAAVGKLPSIGWRPAAGLSAQIPPHWLALPRDWQFWGVLLLWLDFLLTTWFAKDPWAAWPQLLVVSKAMAPMLLTLLLIDTRQKLAALMFTLAICVAAATLKGGYWALMTGFQDRVYGPPGSPYEGNNEFSVVVLMTLPLLLAFRAQARHAGVRLALALLAGLSVVAVLSSWSRGAFLGLAVVSTLLIWHSRRKWLALPVLALGLALAFSALPERLLEHIESIAQYQDDQSAQGRLEAWRVGLEYVRQEPWVGAGFEGWRFMTSDPYTLLGRDWHSVYIQMLTEHGVPGLLLWCALLFGGIYRLTRLMARASRRGASTTASQAAMLRAGLAGYAVSGAFLGIAYWGVLFQMIALAMLLEWLDQRSPEPLAHSAGSIPGAQRRGRDSPAPGLA